MAPSAPPRARADTVRTDEELIASYLRSGVPELFGELALRHQDKVFRLAVSILGPTAVQEAEDLCQEILLEAHDKLASFRGESRFSTWLYRLAWRRTIDRKRLARHRFAHVGEEALPESGAGDGDPAQRVMEHEEREALRRAVEELAEPYRTVVRLYYWLKRPVSEIAEILAVRPGTVKSHLFRAREQLARTLRRR